LPTNIDRAVGVSGTAIETTKGTPASDNSAAVFVDWLGDAAPPPLIRTIGTPDFTSNSATWAEATWAAFPSLDSRRIPPPPVLDWASMWTKW